MPTKDSTKESKFRMINFHIGNAVCFDKPYISAEINVPGLGDIKIEDCLSTETFNRIEAEVILAVKQKMGQK